MFCVLVRPQTYTYGLIEVTGDFTVNVPTPALIQDVMYFGTVSGRDEDKFKARGFTATPGRMVKSPIVEECVIHYECKTVHRNDMAPEQLDAGIRGSAYADGDFHRTYFGEITAAYAEADAAERVSSPNAY